MVRVESAVTVTPAQLPELLLHVAAVRPVFVWGGPWIGRSPLVRAFARPAGPGVRDRVRVRGRGGTTLQPGINLLERAPDFPPGAPILVITDGYCDVLRIRREHAYLVPTAPACPSPREARFPAPLSHRQLLS
jgi:hypothetical protein